MIRIPKRAMSGISGGRVLDVATGEGNFIRALMAHLQDYLVILGIDALEYTRTADSVFCLENVHFALMDAARLGLRDGSFDTVAISSSLHHLDDVPRCLAEMKRVLKPGGCFLLRETHRDVLTEPQRMDMSIHHWVAQVDSALGEPHRETYSRQELVDLVEGLGLCNAVFYDIPNTDLDPMDQAAIQDSDEALDRYLRYTQRLPDCGALRQRGEELRRRLHTIGVQWEPELIVIGEKP
jgi:SAM-dependent methyltransferase